MKNELEHYGVKGMKWKHHKYKTPTGISNPGQRSPAGVPNQTGSPTGVKNLPQLKSKSAATGEETTVDAKEALSKGKAVINNVLKKGAGKMSIKKLGTGSDNTNRAKEKFKPKSIGQQMREQRKNGTAIEKNGKRTYKNLKSKSQQRLEWQIRNR